MLQVGYLNGMLLDIAVGGWGYFSLMDVKLKEFTKFLSIYRLNLLRVSFFFFFHFCPGEVSLHIRVLCPSALEAHPAERVCWWQGVCGLLFLPTGLMGRGRSRNARTLLPSTDPWL